MALNNPVQIREVCRVTPPPDALESVGELSLSLTFFDTLWFKFSPVERIFFYELTPTESTCIFFNAVILPKLKHSLSLTLLHFLPLAGNLTWPPHAAKPFILYTPNDGISVTVAESNADFTYLSRDELHVAAESHPYIPELPISDLKAATIAFQITLFPNQGFSIGISLHHAIFDGRSLAMFIKAWAHICKLNEKKKNPSLLPELTPVFDRRVIQDPEGLDMVYLNFWAEAKLPGLNGSNTRSLKLLPALRVMTELTRATFQLSREGIKKLRQKVLSILGKVPTESPIHLSTFVLTYAYTMVCMVKAKGLEKKRKIGIAFTADCRARLDPPIPANYFGNCVCANYIITEAGPLLEENGIAFVAKRLSDMIKGLEEGVLKGAKEKLAKIGDVEFIGVAGSPRFELYGTDFGWGKPKKTEVISLDRTGAISMAESKDGSGGIEIGLALKKQEMEIFNYLFIDGLLDR